MMKALDVKYGAVVMNEMDAMKCGILMERMEGPAVAAVLMVPRCLFSVMGNIMDELGC